MLDSEFISFYFAIFITFYLSIFSGACLTLAITAVFLIYAIKKSKETARKNINLLKIYFDYSICIRDNIALISNVLYMINDKNRIIVYKVFIKVLVNTEKLQTLF